MRYPKLRELIEAITALIKGPCTTKFPFKEHIPEKRYRGRPLFNKDECVGCGACSEVCPTGCIKINDLADAEYPIRKIEQHYDDCIYCGQCEAACITKKGIKQSNLLDDVSLFDRSKAVESVEKELILCEACGCIVGTKEHLLWISKRLGPLAYSSPTTYLEALKQLKLAYKDVAKKEKLTRQDRVKTLCPKCRREITLNT